MHCYRASVGPRFSVRFSKMSNPFIRVKGLKKHYQMGGSTVRALDGLDLDIDAHTFTVVMGPSGSGKSTLLYLLGGLDRATSGEISLNGARLDEMDENALALFRRRVLGVFPQITQLAGALDLSGQLELELAVEGVNFVLELLDQPVFHRNGHGC